MAAVALPLILQRAACKTPEGADRVAACNARTAAAPAMPTYVLSGVAVDFPYDAYEPQLKYMEAVIVALQRVRPLPLP